MTLNILPSAKDDLAEGAAFYERQEPSMGGYFLDSLSTDIDSLVITGGTHRKVFGFHRLLSKKFPYAIYYVCDEREVEVRAVLDCRRNPSLQIGRASCRER